MDLPHFLLLLLFALTIAHLVSLKVCSLALDHKTAPLFIAGWTLLGLLAVTPLYGGLFAEGWAKMTADPRLLFFAVLKGVALCYLFIVSQSLMQVSLSSRHYVTPLSIGLVTLGNALFGEALSFWQLFSSLGLCLLAAGFFLFGHMADLPARSRLDYARLTLTSAAIAVIDHVLTKDTNWFVLAVVSYSVLFVAGIAWNLRHFANFRQAALHRAAIVAGIFYASTEIVKDYQQVAINPVTVVITVQAMTKPVILVLSALLWKERTMKEQLAWGLMAFVITLPLLLGDDIMAKLWR